MKAKLWKLLAVGLMLVFAVSAFAACAKDPDSGSTAAATTKSVQPTIDVFDYFKSSAWGLTSNTVGVTADTPNGTRFWSHTYMKNGEDQKDGTNHKDLTASESYYHPYKTIAYAELFSLLRNNDASDADNEDNAAKKIVSYKDKYFLIFFGGSWEGTKTTNAAQYLSNALAELYLTGGNGPEIFTQSDNSWTSMYATDNLFYCYNFDFRLSGGVLDDIYDSDIRYDDETYFATSGSYARSVTYLYQQLFSGNSGLTGLSNFIPQKDKDGVTIKSITSSGTGTTSSAVMDLIQSPSVMLIQKTGTDAEMRNNVIGYVDLNGKAEADVKTQVKAMINTGNSGSLVARSDLAVYDYFTKDYRTYSGQDNFSPIDPVTGRSNTTHRYQMITYAELIEMLKTDGNYLIFFGGSWCGYSNGFIRHVEKARAGSRYPMVYVVDSRLDGSKVATGGLNIRHNEQAYSQASGGGRITSQVQSDGKLAAALTGAPFTRLYSHMLSFFGEDFKAYGFLNDDVTIGGEDYTKIGIPALFIYGKNNVDIWGNSKPVIAFYENDYTFSVIRTDDNHPQSWGLDMALGTMLANFGSGLLTYKLIA